MNAQTPCQCSACTASRNNRPAVPERPRYFPRQLITPADLTLEQDYFRDKLRRHNRLLHGWGVVCGAVVCPLPADGGGYQPWMVSVSTGYLLGPYGDEILIDQPCTADLRTAGGTPMAAGTDDPWCTPVYMPRQPGGHLYVAVKYAETQTRPVRVQPSGCGCDNTPCEPSRICDGFEIGVLEAPLPASYPITPPDWTKPHGTNFPLKCPACPTDPWVVLAEIDVDSEGKITMIDNCSVRRLVVSYADFWWLYPSLKITSSSIVKQPAANDGTTPITVTIVGANFMQGVKVDLGANVKVKKVTVNDPGTSIIVTADVAKGASADTLTFTVSNPDCSSATAIAKSDAQRG